MSLTSLKFALFVLGTAVGYFIVPKKVKWCWLLICSTAFYFLQGVALSVWMYVSAASIYVCGLLIGREDARCKARIDALDKADRAQKKLLRQKSTRVKHAWLLVAVVVNVGIWVVFKFTDLIIADINKAFSTSFSLWNLALPLGISFYTFQAVSYVVDVSRGKCEVQKNPLKLALWLSFFPQMFQGPICRYGETAEQLYTPHPFEYRRVTFGIQMVIWGLFKKLVIADRVAVVVNQVFGDIGAYAGFVQLFAAVAYTVQIYCDFSGGIDVVNGVAEILGIALPKNFERPFFSRSVAEFWRRWHITLGGWFRDYVFIPLSISKPANALSKWARKVFGQQFGKMLPTYIALLIVWLLNGVWHGTGKRFALFGLYQGILIMLGMQFEPLFKKLIARLHVNTECFSWRFWQMLRTTILMMFGRLIYRAPDFPSAVRIVKRMFSVFNPWVLTDGTLFTLGLDAWELFIIFVSLIVLLAVGVLQERGVRLRETIARQNLPFRWAVYLAAIFTVILLGYYGKGFNPADFIYANF